MKKVVKDAYGYNFLGYIKSHLKKEMPHLRLDNLKIETVYFDGYIDNIEHSFNDLKPPLSYFVDGEPDFSFFMRFIIGGVMNENKDAINDLKFRKSHPNNTIKSVVWECRCKIIDNLIEIIKTHMTDTYYVPSLQGKADRVNARIK